MTRFHSRTAFSFFEILLAIIFIVTGMVYLFSLMSSSNQGTMDSYHETLAYSVAQETLELVANLGYPRLRGMVLNSNASLQKLGYSSFQQVVDVPLDDGSLITYPEEYKRLERKIEITPSLSAYPPPILVRVVVTVRVREGFFRRGAIVLGKLVGAE